MVAMIRPLVLRHMRRTSSFIDAESATRIPGTPEIRSGEALIGWYQNPPPLKTCVAFTDEAIYKFGEEVTRIPWRDVIGFEMPKSKEHATGIKIITLTGSHYIPMAGSYGPEGKFKDAFSLTMILNVLVKSARK